MSIITQGYGPGGVGGGGGFEIDAVRFAQDTDAELEEKFLDASIVKESIDEVELIIPTLDAEIIIPELDAELDDDC